MNTCQREALSVGKSASSGSRPGALPMVMTHRAIESVPWCGQVNNELGWSMASKRKQILLAKLRKVL
jgi:hypothetical protein